MKLAGKFILDTDYPVTVTLESRKEVLALLEMCKIVREHEDETVPGMGVLKLAFNTYEELSKYVEA